MTQRNLPVSMRLWMSIDVGSPEACWEFSGSKNTRGYGSFRVGGKNILAHRLAWQVEMGDIPDGFWVLHRCDNPPCCNPGHLFLGKVTANSRDMIAKGRDRHPTGREHGFFTKRTDGRVVIACGCRN